MAMNWNDVIGKRVLISEPWLESCKEVVVVEISPSGDFVKLRWPSGNEMWSRKDDYQLWEVLGEPEQGRLM